MELEQSTQAMSSMFDTIKKHTEQNKTDIEYVRKEINCTEMK